MLKKILTKEERKRLVDSYGRMGKAKILAEGLNSSDTLKNHSSQTRFHS